MILYVLAGEDDQRSALRLICLLLDGWSHIAWFQTTYMRFLKYVIIVRHAHSVDDWPGNCKIHNELARIGATLQIRVEFSHNYAPRSTYKGRNMLSYKIWTKMDKCKIAYQTWPRLEI